VDWLNYHHLRYFWVVARQGGVARASRELHITPSAISLQLQALERALGEQLFTRKGRAMVLTDVGRVALRYADEIFSTGQELLDVLRGRPTGRPLRLVVGVASAVTKLVAFRLLRPALKLPDPVRLVCVEGGTDSLIARLAVHGLDLVITDAPLGAGVKVRAFSHLLGECGVTFFARRAAAARLRRGFPGSLDGAPMLLPSEGAMMRRSLDQWFGAIGARPSIVGEFEDSALLKVFGSAGTGVFPVPTIVEREMQRQYDVGLVGRTEEARERYYAISLERRLTHPAVVAISTAARERLFG